MLANLRTVAMVLATLFLAAAPVFSMTIFGELDVPAFHLESDTPERVIYDVCYRLHRHPELRVTSQIADEDGVYYIRFAVLSIDGPGPGPNVNVSLILEETPAGVSSTRSSVSGYGISNEELADHYEKVISPIIAWVLEGGQ